MGAVGVLLRRLGPADDLGALTLLLNRAYAPLAESGMKYLATWQDEAVTAERAAGPGAECWVAEEEGSVVGTITLREPHECEAAWFGRDDVMAFEQFAVAPERQGLGIGRRLLDHAEERARGRGFSELACDTAVPAAALRATYARRGYREVGRVDWDVTNYESVVLSKRL